MDFRFSEEQARFRQEVRRFLEAEIRLGTFKPGCDAWITGYSAEFSRKVAARGWIGLTWPKEYGGQARSYMDRLVLTEELLRYGAPVACHWFADRQVGASIIVFGDEAQKRDILPKIIRGEAFFAIGMSEPEAGSDLASLKTGAMEDGDSFIIDGQKVWTSGATYKNYIYLVARTDSTVPKHKGISEFVMRLDLPGVTIRPLVDMAGGSHFDEVFFDNVRIPKSSLIGEKNHGFQQILAQLDYERSGIERIMANYPLYDALLRYCQEATRQGKPLCQQPLIRQRLAQLEVDFEIGRLLIYRVAAVMDEGNPPNYEAAVAKDFGTAFEQRLANTAMDILGLYGQLIEGSRHVPMRGLAPESYLMCRGYTLMGGTTEILRNIIAQRGLGLPLK
ncbi:MAG: acyl-CoA dehydrogenase family protein [Chloroflexi bacterium]|nr:acyl-CoA dehydrogenase family protein [Chloroflexota bacterium]